MRHPVVLALVLLAACGGGNVTAPPPPFQPDFPLSTDLPVEQDQVAPDRTHTVTLTFEVKDAQHRLVPGATLYFLAGQGSRDQTHPSSTTITPSQATTDATGHATVVWIYFVSTDGDVIQLLWCATYHNTCDPQTQESGSIGRSFPG